MSKPNSRAMVAVPGHPGIYRRGKRYVVVYRVRGKQHKCSHRTLTEARRFKSRTDLGEAVPTGRQGFVAYAGGWLDGYAARTSGGLATSTRASYKDAAERIIVPYFAREAPSIKLDEITPSVLRSFIEYLASQGYAPATVRRYYAPLRAMLATAYEDDLIARNPASGVRVVVPATHEAKRKRLTPEETRLLLSKFPAEYADLAYVMAATGLRIAEVLNLCWSDFATGKDGPALTVRKSKTPAGRRTILVTAPTASRLTKLRTAAQAANDQPIFPSARGTHLDPNNFRRTVFRPAAKEAGLEWATPHTLRHGMASLMADNGCSAAHIASYLGHADGGVLAQRTYIHPTMVRPDFIDDALGC